MFGVPLCRVFGTLAIHHIYPHVGCFTQIHKVNVKTCYITFLGWKNKFIINQICNDKPQNRMLHFLGGLNRTTQGPTSQPEKWMLHFWGVWCVPPKNSPPKVQRLVNNINYKYIYIYIRSTISVFSPTFKKMERLEPTRNPKQPESMLAKGNTSHIKKTHWKNQTTGETGTHTEPKTTWIDACKGKHITHQEIALKNQTTELLRETEPTRNPKQPESETEMLKDD